MITLTAPSMWRSADVAGPATREDFICGQPLFRPPYAASPRRFARGNGSEVVNCFCSPDVIGMAIVILAATMAVHSVSNSGSSL